MLRCTPKVHFPRMTDKQIVEFLEGYLCSRLLEKRPFNYFLTKIDYINLFRPFLHEIT